MQIANYFNVIKISPLLVQVLLKHPPVKSFPFICKMCSVICYLKNYNLFKFITTKKNLSILSINKNTFSEIKIPTLC